MRLWLLALTLSLSIGVVGTTSAQQNIDFDAFDPVYQPLGEAFANADHKAAQRIMKGLERQHGKTADFEFLSGIVTLLQMNDAGALRLPFLARRMRNHWLQAVEYDPNHELAHFSLVQYLANAPGIVGGSLDDALKHRDRLHELNSEHRFMADIVIALVREDEAAELAAWDALFEAQPDNAQIRVNYAAQKINQEQYERALEQLQAALALVADSDEEADTRTLTQLHYQWGKLAAVSGIELEQGAAFLSTLLADDRLPEGMNQGWVQFRLAQIEQHRENGEAANERFSAAEQFASDDENLRKALTEQGRCQRAC